MKRISTSTRVADKFGAGKHGFTDGNAATGILPTDLEGDLFDHLQEELCAIVEEDGGAAAPPVAVDASARNQVITKLKALFARKLQATETVDGTAKVATQAETDAGTDDARIITPKKLRWGFAASFAGNGYVKLPSWLGGLIFQWGLGTADASCTFVATFPLAFPTLVFIVIGSHKGGGGATFAASNPTLTGFTGTVSLAFGTPSGGNGYQANWLAVGK
jgi:hypothetical protein